MSLFRPSSYITAQFAHSGWGYLLTTAPVLFFHIPGWIFALATLLYAVGKETYDYEIGDTLKECLIDVGVWLLGIGAGLAAVRW